MTDFVLHSLMQAGLFVVLGGIGLWGVYRIGKKLLKNSGEIDRKVIKEAHKEVYEEILEMYWPKLNKLMREGFTVPDIVPDKNDKPETERKKDLMLTQENHPELFNPDGILKMELPVQITLK